MQNHVLVFAALEGIADEVGHASDKFDFLAKTVQKPCNGYLVHPCYR